MDASRVVVSSQKKPEAGAPPLARAIGAVGAVSPFAAAWLAERLWFTPPRPTVPTQARAALAKGRPMLLDLDGRRVTARRFGTREPAVVLMHGWGGHSGQLVPFVAPLLEAGLQVVTFDALGHGRSPSSRAGVRLSTFFDFAAGMRAIAEQVGPLRAVVAHSGGAVATGIALRQGLEVERLVMLAPMTRPGHYARLFSAALGLSEQVDALWQARAHRRLGSAWADFDLTQWAGARPPTLIVHDRDDREVPFADGEALAQAWPETELMPVTALGHRRLLRDATVLQRTTEFLTRR